MLLQMGGPAGVRASEQYTLVTGLTNGMLMHALPRVPHIIKGNLRMIQAEPAVLS